MVRGTWQGPVHGVAESQTQLSVCSASHERHKYKAILNYFKAIILTCTSLLIRVTVLLPIVLGHSTDL